MNILKELYYGNIAEIQRKPKAISKTRVKKEFAVYDKIKAKLSPDDFALLEKFLELYDERKDAELQETYIQGFKTGIQIGFESNKLKL